MKILPKNYIPSLAGILSLTIMTTAVEADPKIVPQSQPVTAVVSSTPLVGGEQAVAPQVALVVSAEGKNADDIKTEEDMYADGTKITTTTEGSGWLTKRKITQIQEMPNGEKIIVEADQPLGEEPSLVNEKHIPVK